MKKNAAENLTRCLTARVTSADTSNAYPLINSYFSAKVKKKNVQKNQV